MNRYVISCLLLMLWQLTTAQHNVSSPDNNINVSVSGGKSLTLAVRFKGAVILNSSDIGLSMKDLNSNWTIRKTATEKRDEFIYPPVPEKRKSIRDYYQQLTLEFKSKLSLEVRVYNDGFAYRFKAALKDSITVEKEVARYSLPGNTIFYGPPVVNQRVTVVNFKKSFAL